MFWLAPLLRLRRQHQTRQSRPVCAGDDHTTTHPVQADNMATSHQENTALLTEHFRYTPLVCIIPHTAAEHTNILSDRPS